jgi:hypothetical protein
VSSPDASLACVSRPLCSSDVDMQQRLGVWGVQAYLAHHTLPVARGCHLDADQATGDESIPVVFDLDPPSFQRSARIICAPHAGCTELYDREAPAYRFLWPHSRRLRCAWEEEHTSLSGFRHAPHVDMHGNCDDSLPSAQSARAICSWRPFFNVGLAF